jgi:uncharacterized protein DUF4153
MDLAVFPIEGAAPAHVEDRGKRRALTVLLGVLALGVLTQALLWGARIGLGWFVLDVTLVGASFAFLRRGPVTPAAVLVGGGAILLGGALVYYASDWALAVAFPGNVALLLVLPFVLSRPAPLFELGALPRTVLGGALLLPRAVAGSARFSARALDKGNRKHALGLLRGLLIGVPAACLFAALLSADPSFRDALFRAADGSFEIVRFVVYSVGVAALYLVVYVFHARGEGAEPGAAPEVSGAAAPGSGPYRLLDAWAPPAVAPEGPVVRPFTWSVVLAQIALVFAGFVAVHVRYLFGGHALVRAPGPLTYATYLHAGLAQLSTAALLAVLLVIAGHFLVRDRSADRSGPVPGGKALGAVEAILLLLTGVTLLSCWQRLRIYEEAYGYTHLRLAVGFVQLGISGLLALTLAKSIARAWRGYGASLVLLGIGLTVVAALFNSDLYVARGNLERAAAGHELDVDYLAGLSADARGVLAHPALRDHDELRRMLEAGWREQAADRAHDGWRAFRGLSR